MLAEVGSDERELAKMAGLGLVGPEAVSLLQARSTRGEMRAAMAAVALYVVVLLCVAPLAGIGGLVAPQVATIVCTVLVIVELTTAFLLGAEVAAEPDLSALLVTAAYLFSALSAVGYVLTLPGAVMAARPLIGDGRVAAHIYIVWRMGFIGLILAA
jgi:hypothetical protein